MKKRNKTSTSVKNKILMFVSFIFVLVFSFFHFNGKQKFKEVVSINSNTPISTTSPETEVVESQSAEQLLGSAEVSFAGSSAGREKNIELGISHIDGKVINPGDEFSFTKVLGPVTKEEGYSDEKVFLNGEVTKGIGGGLCQVSTTLFQSVIKAGLRVTERHNHSYTVSRYDVGLDATYSDPGPDFRFKNDTKNPLIIKGRTENKKVVFEIYGTSDGRVSSTTDPEITEVVDFPPARYVATTTRSKSEPECVNTPQIGYTSKVMYSVFRPDLGTTTTQIFKSVYKPLQRVCYFNPENFAKN